MEERVNYTIVGMFVVALTVFAVAIAYWLSTDYKTKSYDKFVIYMREPVAGLSVMGPVKYNGVVVGFVDSIQLDKDNPQLVRLVVSIAQSTPITTSTVATLRPQGITGLTYIGLKSKTAIATRIKVDEDEPYPVIPSEPSFLVYFSDALKSVTENINTISARFQDLFNEDSVKDLKVSFKSIAQVTQTLANNAKEIDASVKSATRVLHNASLASEHLPVVMKRLKHSLVTIEDMAKELKKASRKVGLTMSDSRVAVQNLAQQALPAAVRTLDHLERVTQNLEQLTTEMQHNPSILLRGKAAPKPGPGE